MNNVRIELLNHQALQVDDLVSGDIEVTLFKRDGSRWEQQAKFIIPKHRRLFLALMIHDFKDGK